MGKLAESYVEIGSKTSGFDAGLSKAEKSLMEFTSRAGSLVGALGVGVGVAGLVRGFAEMASKASDLGETISKTGQVFGDSTAKVTSFADEMATKFGAVKQTTLDAASMFGLIAQGAGLSTEASAKLSTQLVRLADDASSFFNVGLDVALEKIRAGLVGESEPLRAFGVMLSETAVQQQAVSMGLATTSKDLTEQEKVLARVELITRGLQKAQGDHERTMGSYANQIRKLSGEWENLKAEMGAPLAGGVAAMLQSGREKGWLQTLDDIADSFWNMVEGKEGNAFQKLTDKTAGVAVGLPQPPSKIDPLFAWGAARAAEAVARRQQAWEAGRFNGGGFGAFGMFGDLGQKINMAGLDAEIARRRAAMERGSWSGGFGGMSSFDFARAAQESINRPQDETARKQLDELVKIREAVSRPKQAAPDGVVLRGPA